MLISYIIYLIYLIYVIYIDIRKVYTTYIIYYSDTDTKTDIFTNSTKIINTQ